MTKILSALFIVFVYFSTIKNIQPAKININCKQSYTNIGFKRRYPFISPYNSDFLHRCFSTSGVRCNITQLFINSKLPSNIVFTQGKAVLMISPLKPFLWPLENAKDVEFINGKTEDVLSVFNGFNTDLTNITQSLLKRNHSFYVLEFFIYFNMESEDGLYRPKGLAETYVPDVFNKDCLNKVWGQFGYIHFSTVLIHIDGENNFDRVSYINAVISSSIQQLWDGGNARYLWDLNRDTLLIINETSEECWENWENKFNTPPHISGLSDSKLGVSYNQYRYFSTSRVNLSNTINKGNEFSKNKNSKNNNNNNNNNSFLKRIIKGFKISFFTPSLPENVLKIHNNIFIRIFRVLGGISIVTYLSGSGKAYLFASVTLWPVYYLVLLLAILHFIYIIVLKIIKIRHLIKVWRAGELEVRNSPVDKLATAAAKVFQCWKIGCELGSAGLGFIGTGFLVDQILESGGKPKMFTPLVGQGVQFLIGGVIVDGPTEFNRISEEISQMNDLKKANKEVHKSLKTIEDQLENSSMFNKEDINSIKKGFEDLRKADEFKMARAANKIKSKIESLTNNRAYSTYTRRSFSYSHYKLQLTKDSGITDKKPKMLAIFLKIIRDTINNNKNDLTKAQLILEEQWLELAYNLADVKTSFFRNQNHIFKNALETLEYIEAKGIFKRNYKELAQFILNPKHLILTFSLLTTFYSRTTETNLSAIIGRNIFISIYKTNFINNVNIELRFNSFIDFCKHFSLDNRIFIKLGSSFIDIFSTQIGIKIFERKNINNEGYFLVINKEYIDEIKDNLIINPQALPMISQPNLWSEKERGGFLLNKNDDSFNKDLITGSEHHSHSFNLDDNVYNVINRINSQKFKVNSDFVNYIENEGSFILEHYKNNSKNYINNVLSLDVAKLFIDIPFYLNVSLDWRGRIYTQSFFLDYQGSEFSLALIDLYQGEKLDKEGIYYYYIYGANCYNFKQITRKSFSERYQWVLDNHDKIYNMDKDFILNAESPAIFAAFCINYKKNKDDPNYIHYTPCFLDATCSGIQHLAAMLLDYDLAYNVNLLENKEVNDVYSSLIDPINKAINNSWLEDKDGKDETLKIFSEIKLSRKELKKLIMVKSYNVTLYGMTQHLKDSLDKKEVDVTYIDKKGKEKVTKDYLYYVTANNPDGYVMLNDTQLFKLSNIINNNIFNKYNSLKIIYTFLTDLVRCMVATNIPVSWATPLGLEITQKYNLSTTNKMSISFLGKNKTTVLKDWTNEVDKRKQVQAVIPNIVHSFDAAHLMKVVLDWDKDKYILPIHDCFGTHPNNMKSLSETVKKQFVTIYSEYDFLLKLKENLNASLKNYKIKTVTKNGIKYVEVERKNKDKNSYMLYYKIPTLPRKGKLNIQDVLKSTYIIS